MVGRLLWNSHESTWKAPQPEAKNVSGNFFNNSLSNWRKTYLSIKSDLRPPLDQLTLSHSSGILFHFIICKERRLIQITLESFDALSVTWFRERIRVAHMWKTAVHRHQKRRLPIAYQTDDTYQKAAEQNKFKKWPNQLSIYMQD